MKKLKIGWVGSGFVGQAAHLEHFIRFPEAEVVALAELRSGLREKVTASYNIPKSVPSHKELLANIDCDAVVAVVNRKQTFGVAIDILEAGLHLLTEKPMAQTKEAARQLVEIANDKGVTYSVGFMRRYDNGVRKAKKIIEELRRNQELGKVISVRVFVEAGNDYCGITPRIETREPRLDPGAADIAPHWLPKKFHQEYEMFVNVCSHDINLLRFLISENPLVTAVDYRASGYSYALLDFGEFPGVLEWVMLPDALDQGREGIEVQFEKGKIQLNLPPAFQRNVSSEIVISPYKSTKLGESSESRIQGDYSWSFENSDLAFVEHALKGSKSDHSGQDSLKDFDIIDQIWQKIE